MGLRVRRVVVIASTIIGCSDTFHVFVILVALDGLRFVKRDFIGVFFAFLLVLVFFTLTLLSDLAFFLLFDFFLRLLRSIFFVVLFVSDLFILLLVE